MDSLKFRRVAAPADHLHEIQLREAREAKKKREAKELREYIRRCIKNGESAMREMEK